MTFQRQQYRVAPLENVLFRTPLNDRAVYDTYHSGLSVQFLLACSGRFFSSQGHDGTAASA